MRFNYSIMQTLAKRRGFELERNGRTYELWSNTVKEYKGIVSEFNNLTEVYWELKLFPPIY